MSKRKGVTIVELVVVLAVVAIVSVMVVSFTIMVRQKVTISNAKVDVIGEIEVVEKLVDTWIDSQIVNNAVIVVDDNSLIATIEEKEYELSFYIDKVSSTFFDKEDFSYSFEKIKNISFEKIEKGTDVIFFCTIDYFLIDNAEDEVYSYVFCVNPYVGDIIRGD